MNHGATTVTSLFGPAPPSDCAVSGGAAEFEPATSGHEPSLGLTGAIHVVWYSLQCHLHFLTRIVGLTRIFHPLPYGITGRQQRVRVAGSGGGGRENGHMASASDDFDLTMEELRAVVRFAADSAETVLGDYEADVREDSRPREALVAARAFAAGAPRTNLQRTTATAAHRAAKSAPTKTAQLAARARGDAAAAAYLHPITRATQVGHILGAAACVLLVAELRAGDEENLSMARINAFAEQAVSPLPDVLRRYPVAPQGTSRLSQLMSALDAAIRNR